MDLEKILKGIRIEIAATASRPIYREEEVVSDPSRKLGYGVWTFDADTFYACSNKYTHTVEGDLDIISYATGRTERHALHEEMMEVWFPTVGGKRTPLGPKALSDAYLHCVQLVDINEVFSEKTGHQETETPGIMISIRLKIST